MSDTEKKILENLKNVLPDLPETEKSYFLGYCEAFAVMKKNRSSQDISDELAAAV